MTSKPAHSVFVLCCPPSHTHTHTLIHIHIYSHTHEHTYIPTHGCTHTHHTSTSTSSQMHSHSHINTHKYMHIDIYSNTHTPHTSFWLLPPPPLWQKFMLSHKIRAQQRNICLCESSFMLPFGCWALPHTQGSQRQGRMPLCQVKMSHGIWSLLLGIAKPAPSGKKESYIWCSRLMPWLVNSWRINSLYKKWESAHLFSLTFQEYTLLILYSTAALVCSCMTKYLNKKVFRPF